MNQQSSSLAIKVHLCFWAGYRNSRMLGQVPEDVLTYLRKEPVTQNEHKYGMLVDVSSQLLFTSFKKKLCSLKLKEVWSASINSANKRD